MADAVLGPVVPGAEAAVHRTGQLLCHDADGHEIPCHDTGQDAQTAYGVPWPEPRLILDGQVVHDRLTGLVWTLDANPARYPLSWEEALRLAERMSREAAFGRRDWRMPNRRELRSLVGHAETRPALPAGHPFRNVFQGWCWSSTTAAINPAFAWWIHLGGGRMFFGEKESYALLWPVAGSGIGCLCTGQRGCFDEEGTLVACVGTGQDGELRLGRPWPDPRFRVQGDDVVDLLTGLRWMRRADLCGAVVTWSEALDAVRLLNGGNAAAPWRLPNINELESLVDCARHSPALPGGHPFLDVAEEYWSSTTSAYEPDWAWALYLAKGGVGVGQKRGRHFRAWAVREG